MRILVPLFLFAALSFAQLRSAELTFEGVNCAPCLESLPSRIQRLRGVESATVDAAKGVLTVKFAAANRVRLEQIRDTIEQDGTKVRRAVIAAAGGIREEPAASGKWILELPAPGLARFAISFDGAPPSAQYSPKPGQHVVLAGRIAEFPPASSGALLTVIPTSIDPAE